LSAGDSIYSRKFVGNFRDSRDNVFDMYGDSRENLLEILAVAINLSTVSSVRGPSLGWSAYTTVYEPLQALLLKHYSTTQIQNSDSKVEWLFQDF